ncbi:hypothetical protein BKA56DRAFT_649891, partial [Ilyonectria sp. MPI-CAGE-AT-0026]
MKMQMCRPSRKRWLSDHPTVTQQWPHCVSPVSRSLYSLPLPSSHRINCSTSEWSVPLESTWPPTSAISLTPRGVPTRVPRNHQPRQSRPVGPSYSTWGCPPPKRHWRRLAQRRSVKGESPKAQPPLMGGVSCWGGGIGEPSWPWAGGTIAGLNRDCSYELTCSP